MNSTYTQRLQQVLVQAREHELLPHDATMPDVEQPSWIILALSFVGAQLAVWPFLLFLAMTMGEFFHGPYMLSAMSAMAFAGSVVVLRRQGRGIFLTQLGFTVLLVGVGLWTVALFEFDLERWFMLFMGLTLLALACLVRVPWVWTLLGMAAAVALAHANLSYLFYGSEDIGRWRVLWQPASPLNLCLLAAVWWLWCAYEHRLGHARWLRGAHAIMEGISVGLLLELLFGASWHAFSGSPWASGPSGSADVAYAGLTSLFHLNRWTLPACSIAIASGLWLACRWDWLSSGRMQTDQPANSAKSNNNADNAAGKMAAPELALWLVLYGMWAILSLVISKMSILAVLFTVSLATGRRRTLVLTLLVLLAQLSAFYYALQWPLVNKAALLAVLGGVLAAALWGLDIWGKRLVTKTQRNQQKVARTTKAPPHAVPASSCHWVLVQRVGLALGLVLSLGLSQWDVVNKEQVLAQGQKIYIPLVPRDPRSLMQGDYMALRFDLPRSLMENREGERTRYPLQTTVLAVARLDQQGVATLLRRAKTPETLAEDEVLVPLKYMKNDWVVVTNAYFFPEGMGRVFSTARYGEFRVLDKGKVLLAGLADEKLQRIKPRPDALGKEEEE
jgi:Uncharacterized membrane-anchored protein